MPNKRGNQGYGKVEMVKQNFDKFSPVFWDLMGELAKSSDRGDQKFFIQEFNKIQTRMIPQSFDPDTPLKIEHISGMRIVSDGD